jgi:lycopene cyclase domain-containing protein
MTYAGFLFWFLIVPMALLLIVAMVDRSRGRQLPLSLRSVSPAMAILLHALIALLYTTIWDNYLVATGVWYYDPALVLGVTFGYVPLEEYTFFLLQPIVAGLWLLAILRRSAEPPPGSNNSAMRWWSVGVVALVWLGSVVILAAGWEPGTYMGLELIWALPPIALQLAFGADILWRYRRPVLLALLSTTVYLSLADALAIGLWGIWDISPEQSTGVMLGGVLPVEEFLFFFLTSTLVIFGITLVMAQESRERFRTMRGRLGLPVASDSRYGK